MYMEYQNSKNPLWSAEMTLQGKLSTILQEKNNEVLDLIDKITEELEPTMLTPTSDTLKIIQMRNNIHQIAEETAIADIMPPLTQTD